MPDMVEFPVTELGPTDHVEAGEQAPDFTRPLVNDEYWENVALSELYGDDPVVLVFHPMDGDFPSTYFWNEIRDRGWGEHATVVGCSISTPYEHAAFVEERGMGYRLFSDPANGIGEAYGIAHELDGMAGISEPRPAIFVIGGEGTIEYAWVSTKWPELPDYDAVEALIEDW
mgnify:CR=1 FL=1